MSMQQQELWSSLGDVQQETTAGGLKDTSISFSTQTISGAGGGFLGSTPSAGGNTGDSFIVFADLVSFSALFRLLTEVGGLF